MAKSSALQRYNVGILTLSALYAAALIGAEWLFKRHAVSGWVAYVVAVLPALPIVGIFLVMGRYLVEQRDEYVRMLFVRQSLIASGLALSVATMWGFLESFRMAPHIDAYYVAVLWFGGLGVGDCFNKLSAGRRHE